MARCKANTNSGTRCKNSAQEGSDYCYLPSHGGKKTEKDMTAKEKRFVEEYCIDCNATQAAIRAGYSKKTATEIGYENLIKPHIETAIKKRMDRLSMKAEEVTKRLTDWGRGSILPFMGDDDFSEGLDLSSEDAIRNIHLIKKIKQRERVLKSEGDQEETVLSRTFEIELHDAKDATIQIGKIRGMYTDKVEITGNLDIKGVNFE